MKQLEDKGRKETEKQGERGGKEERSTPNARQRWGGISPQFSEWPQGGTACSFHSKGKWSPFEKQKLARKKNHQHHSSWLSQASPGVPPEKLPTFILQEMWKSSGYSFPAVGDLSYLWSLLWPSDYGDPSDGQTGVILRVLLQDILWSSKGARLAQGIGDVSEGSGGWPLPSKTQSPLQLHCLPLDSTNTHTLNRSQIARVPQGPQNTKHPPSPKKFLKSKSPTSLRLPQTYCPLIIRQQTSVQSTKDSHGPNLL